MFPSRHARASSGAMRGVAVVMLWLAGCGGSGSSPPAAAPAREAPAASDAVAFVGVDVVPMDSEILYLDQTVVVQNRRISAAGSRGQVAIPEGAQRIDGSGRVLMPGLVDMHVHLEEEDLPRYLARGITSVRNMWGHSAVRDMSRRISAGTLAAGWLNMDPSKIPEVVTWTWEAGAYVCPTLVVIKVLTRRNNSAGDADLVEENRRQLVNALHRGGVPILLGTDSGIDVVSPGTSVHEELAELTRAGLSPYAALAAATVVAAEFLGRNDEFGAVRVGLRADLLLLEGNPLDDVGAAAEPAGVMVSGEWYPAAALAALSSSQDD